MKRFSVHLIIAAVLLAAVAVAAHLGQNAANNSQAGSGAFRDGVYQARLDAQLGRKAHLRSGRWSSDADRTSFVAGYEQEYNQLFAASPHPSVSHPADLVGFRDGISDASEDRRLARPFALRNGEVARISKSRSGNNSEYAAHYAQAYANGYQHGYYASRETLESQVIPEKGTEN